MGLDSKKSFPEELAEKSVESFVLWRERDEVRPATSKEFPDLRAEGHVVFDELVAAAQQPAHGKDFRRWEMQALKAVAVGSERIGENEGVSPIILGSAHRIPVAETVDLFGIDGENGDAAVKLLGAQESSNSIRSRSQRWPSCLGSRSRLLFDGLSPPNIP